MEEQHIGDAAWDLNDPCGRPRPEGYRLSLQGWLDVQTHKLDLAQRELMRAEAERRTKEEMRQGIVEANRLISEVHRELIGW